jgi:hypothetical protein
MRRTVFKELRQLTREDLNCFNDAQLSELTGTGVLRRIANREFRFEFIGAIAIERMVIYVVPAFEVAASIDVGLSYVRIIQRYLSETTRTATDKRLDSIPLVMTTFTELNSFFSRFGFFHERKTLEVRNSKSPISWGKTVNRGDVILAKIPTDGMDEEIASAFYPTPVRQRVSSVQGELSDLFKKILTILASFIAPIMRLRHPLEVHANYDRLSDWLSSIVARAEYYRRLLRRLIPLESGSRRRVLKVLFDFLSDEHRETLRSLSGTTFTFGVDRFDRIWEDACIRTLGAERGSKLLAQPALVSSQSAIKIGKQQLDGLVKYHDEGRAVIIDAKNYSVHNGVPTKDIMKQFGYFVSAAALQQQMHLANALIFPGDAVDGKFRYAGKVVLELDGQHVESSGDIFLLEADPSAILRPYAERRVCKDTRSKLQQLIFGISETEQMVAETENRPRPQPLSLTDLVTDEQRLSVNCGVQSLDIIARSSGCTIVAGAELISPILPRIGQTRWITRKGYSNEAILAARSFVDRLRLSAHSRKGSVFVLHEDAEIDSVNWREIVEISILLSDPTSDITWNLADRELHRVSPRVTTSHPAQINGDVRSPVHSNDRGNKERLSEFGGLQFSFGHPSTSSDVTTDLEKLLRCLNNARHGQALTRDADDPAFFEVPGKELGIYTLKLGRDGAEFDRGKVLVPVRLADLARFYVEFQILIWLHGEQMTFLLNWKDVEPHMSAASKHFVGDERCAKFFVRGLVDSNPGLFLKPKANNAIVNMVSKMLILGPDSSDQSLSDGVARHRSSDDHQRDSQAVVEKRLGIKLHHKSHGLYVTEDGTSAHFSMTSAKTKDGYIGIRRSLFELDWLVIYQTRDSIGWLIPVKFVSDYIKTTSIAARQNGRESWDLWIEIMENKDRLWKSDVEGDLDIRPFRFDY